MDRAGRHASYLPLHLHIALEFFTTDRDATIAYYWDTHRDDERVQDVVGGDFLGDRRADVFYADGDEWFISDGGVGPSTAIDRSSYRVRDPEAWAPANVAAAIAHQRLVDRLN